MRRAGSTGNAAGITETYRGTTHGDRVGGEFTSSWPRPRNKTGNWYDTLESTSNAAPSPAAAYLRPCTNRLR